MDPQFPPQSRAAQLIGSLLILMGIAVTLAIWMDISQSTRSPQGICALPTGDVAYPTLFAFIAFYCLRKCYGWAHTTPHSGSSWLFFLPALEHLHQRHQRFHPPASYCCSLLLVCACVYRLFPRKFRTMSVVLTRFIHMHMYLGSPGIPVVGHEVLGGQV